jgi:hypothetical protein
MGVCGSYQWQKPQNDDLSDCNEKLSWMSSESPLSMQHFSLMLEQLTKELVAGFMNSIETLTACI